MSNAYSIEICSLKAGGKVLFGHLRFEIKRGGRLAVVGASGIGKTTIFRSLLAPELQSVSSVNTNVSSWSYCPQREGLVPWLTVAEHGELLKCERKVFRADLEALEVEGLQGQKVWTLSSGQYQRVSLALCVNIAAEALIVDEPFTALDMRLKEIATAFLKDRSGRFSILVFASHDLDTVFGLSTEVGVLKRSAGFTIEPITKFDRREHLASWVVNEMNQDR